MMATIVDYDYTNVRLENVGESIYRIHIGDRHSGYVIAGFHNWTATLCTDRRWQWCAPTRTEAVAQLVAHLTRPPIG